MAKELWTVAQAAEALSVSEDTVRRLINGGQLPAYQITARTTRLDPLDVYAYLDSR
ncbi:MAG: helix-turn-helix domain-containing protein, partial [Clostridia bacterium]|nr:helix-turn-helix domain-containing protein [Clostridia bacterium]